MPVPFLSRLGFGLRQAATRRLFSADSFLRQSATSVTTDQKFVRVTFDDGSNAAFPNLWLRDHCQCPKCTHPQTKQRLLDTFSIPSDIHPINTTVSKDGKTVSVQWSHENHESRFDSDWIRDATKRNTDSISSNYKKKIWSADSMKNIPKISYDKVMSSNEALRDWVAMIYEYGFAILTNTPPNAQGTADAASRIGVIRRTFYGDLWTFSANLAHSDLAYTDSYIGTHIDGNYFQDTPGLQAFHVIDFEGTGSDTLLTDGFYAAELLRKTNPEHFDILTKHNVPYQYERDEMRLRQQYKTICLDASGNISQIHFNNEDRATLNFSDSSEVMKFYEAWIHFGKILRRPDVELNIGPLTPGNLLVTDNWRVLHGRKQYTGRRAVAGCYVNTEDYISKLRYLTESLKTTA